MFYSYVVPENYFCMNKQMQLTHAICVSGVKCSLCLGAYGGEQVQPERLTCWFLFWGLSLSEAHVHLCTSEKKDWDSPTPRTSSTACPLRSETGLASAGASEQKLDREGEERDTIRATPVAIPIVPGSFHGCAYSAETAVKSVRSASGGMVTIEG